MNCVGFRVFALADHIARVLSHRIYRYRMHAADIHVYIHVCAFIYTFVCIYLYYIHLFNFVLFHLYVFISS